MPGRRGPLDVRAQFAVFRQVDEQIDPGPFKAAILSRDDSSSGFPGYSPASSRPGATQ